MRVLSNLFGDGSKINASQIAVTASETVADALTEKMETLNVLPEQPFAPYSQNTPTAHLKNGVLRITGAWSNTRVLTIAETAVEPIKIAELPIWAYPANRPNGEKQSPRVLNQGSNTAIWMTVIEFVGGKWYLSLVRHREFGADSFTAVPISSYLVTDITYLT